MINANEVYQKIKPFIARDFKPTTVTQVISGGGGGTATSFGTLSGTIANSQAPQFLLRDGSRSLTGNMAVDAGVTIDGVDISAHAADPNAHHTQQHSVVGGDHTLTGAKWSLVGATALNTLGLITPSSAPGATEAILKSDASGGIALPLVTASTSVTTPLLIATNRLGINTGTSGATESTAYNGVYVHAASNAAVQLLTPNTSVGLITFGDPDDNDIGRILYRHSTDVLDFETGAALRMRLGGSTYTVDITGSAQASVSLTTPIINTASGNLTIAPAGDLILDPVGNDVLPLSNYDINLGAINKKYLTLYAAELWVETLVAQETIATIGGRILVGPTTALTADLSPGATSIVVKHNSLNNNDIVYMEADGKIEFMTVTSGYSGTGPYTYSVTRNLDGTGANQWYAGDAVFNTGQAGNGFIDLYSLYGIPRNGQSPTNRAGPTIVGNVRLSSTYNDFRERWAVGSLNGLYDYSTSIYGFAAGDPTATWVGLDATNGLRMMSSTTKRMEITPGGVLNINNSAGTNVITLDNSGASYFAGVMTIGTSGEIRQGTGALGADYTGLRIWRDTNVGRIGGYNSNNLQWYADTDGRLYAGAGANVLDRNGISVANSGTSNGITFYRVSTFTDTYKAGRLWALSDLAPQVYFSAGRSTGDGDATNAAGILSLVAYNSSGIGGAAIVLNGGSGTATVTGAMSTGALSVTGNISVTGNVDGVDVSAFKSAYDSHTHSYLPLSGGTLSGTLTAQSITFATDNTYDIGASDKRVQDLYVANLHVDTIVGTPAYSHHHDASDIDAGVLDEARLPHTWSGALTLDADAAAGSSNYLRLATQTGAKFWDLIGRAYDYGTAAQQNDLLLTYYDGTSTYIVWQADSGSRVIDFLNAPTVGGTAVSLSGHTHDDRYYTESEINSLLAGYVPTSRTVSAGSGLTGGGALSANITLTLDTPGSLSATSTNTASGNHTHAVSASEAPGTSTALLKAVGGLLTLPQFTATTKVITPLIEATSRLGISTGASGVTESTAYNGVYVHAASNAAIQLLAPNTSVGLVTFGDPDDNDIGRILYRHSTDVLDFEAGAALRMRLGGSTYTVDITGSGRFTGALYADTGVTTSSGNLSLTSASGIVSITGAATISSTLTATGAILAAAGAVGTPGVAQSSDPDTGMYWPAANTLAFSAGGTQRLQLSSTGGAVTGILSATSGMVTPSVTTASGNLALSGAGGSVIITGALVGSAWDITNTGTATMATSVIAPTYTSASGNTTVTAPATLVLNAATANSVELQVNSVSQWSANDTRLNPRSTVVMDLGDYNRKLRTLYAAEMYVETLVAQDVMSTIGGRILVAPTTTLIADLSNSATTNLYSNLQAYWSLDEASGNKADSKSGNTLTNTNTVATVVGKVGSASSFTKASSQYLTIADNATLSVGDIDFYFSFWLYPTLDDDTDQYIAAKAGGSGNRAWDLRIDWVNARLRFTVYNSSDAATTVNSANSSVAINTWHFIECWHDSVNNQIAVAINNGTAVTAAHTTGVKDDTGPFQIGARNASSFFQGYVDGFGFWKYIPSSTDRAFLYNSGNGRTYANMVAWSSIDVKHNSLSSGTYVYLQTAPGGISQIEAMQIISSATAITGGYRYQTLRNLDGTGNNTWVAGDAVVSLGGAIGQGYIDLTSTSTIHSHLGPTITVFSRSDTAAWNSVKPVVTMGNLRSFVDYSGDEYGQAAGNDLTLNPASGFQGYTIDRTNGLRLFNTDLRLYNGATESIRINNSVGMRFITGSSAINTVAWYNSIGGYDQGYLYGDLISGTASLNLRARSRDAGTGAFSGYADVILSNAITSSSIKLLAHDGSVNGPNLYMTVADTGTTINGMGLSVYPPAGTVGLYMATPASQSTAMLYIVSADCGSGHGPHINIGRNSNGSTPAAGFIYMQNRAGTSYSWWVDNAGIARVGALLPTSANDTGGTAIGTQTSSLDSKNIIEPFTDYSRALNAIIDAPLYNFIYKNGAFGGQRFTGIVTDYAPTFGMDRDEVHPAGKSLNEITAHGYTFAAIKALHARIEELENQVRMLTHAN